MNRLDTDRVLSLRNGRATFQHDLYGDWIRLQELLRANDDGGVAAFLETRLQSPIWQRAFRLYGLFLLEQGGGLRAWQDIFDEFSGSNDGIAELACDLLLEACAHADGSASALNELWPVLAADEGVLLDRLLRRLSHSATLPNPVVLERVREAHRLAKDDAGVDYQTMETYLAAIARIPYWPYWYPLVRVLHEHRDSIPARALSSVSQVADLWLRFTADGWGFREEAAELAISLGEQLLRDKQSRDWAFGDGEKDRAVHRALLAASSVRPAEAAALLLEAAGRRKQRFAPPPITDEQIDSFRAKLEERGLPPLPLLGRSRRKADPWPDGPALRVDEALQHVVLETDALRPLAEAAPEAAKELLLALLINEPQEISYGSTRIDDYALEHPRWHPPFYTRGPFLDFLQVNEKEAIDAIIRLIRHFTNRRIEILSDLESRHSHRFSTPNLVIWDDDKNRTFIGDSAIWLMAVSDSGGVAHSALSSLEKHLYDRIDAGDDLSNTIEQILSDSDSLPIVGLLTSVGFYAPILFQGPLRSFLTSPELMAWTTLGTRHDGWEIGLLRFSGPSLLPEPLHEAYRAWHQMKHRGLSLRDLGVAYFLNDDSFKKTYATARQRWLKELAHGGLYEGSTMVENFAAQFDIDNYTVVVLEEGRLAFQYTPPQVLQDKATEGEQDAQDDMLVLSVPFTCRQLLDNPEGEASADDLWAIAEKLDVLDPGKWGHAPTSVLDAQAGVAAVLAVRCTVEPGERLQWVRARLLEASQTVRETLGSHMSWNSQAFAADAVPVLWALSPQDPEVRGAIARLALSGGPELVSRLAVAVKHARDNLSEDHVRLLTLILHRAQSEPRLRRLRMTVERYKSFDEDSGGSEEIETELSALELDRDQIFRAFLDGTLTAHLPLTQALASSTSVAPQRGVASPRRQRPRRLADENLLVAAFNGVPLPEEREADWSNWADVWGKAVAEVSEALSLPPDAPTRDVEGVDGPWDDFVLRHAAYLSLSAHSDEEARSYWEPVLALGPTASFSVDSFLRTWVAHALNAPVNPTIHRRWGQMIDYAAQHPRWSREDRSGWHTRERLWRLIVGLQSLSSDTWTSQHSPLVKALSPYLQRWAVDHPFSSDDIVELAVFLALPAARSIRLEGLNWINTAVQAQHAALWTEHISGEVSRFSRAETAVADLLVIVWNEDRERLRRHTEGFSAFQTLLTVLTKRQLPLALELSQRVGDS